MLYDHAARWSRRLGQPDAVWEEKAKALERFIQEELWDPESGFFYDRWTVREPEPPAPGVRGDVARGDRRGDARPGARVIDEHLLNPKEFFAPHPIATVALSDPKFELRMWRGPAWNCMTYWAAGLPSLRTSRRGPATPGSGTRRHRHPVRPHGNHLGVLPSPRRRSGVALPQAARPAHSLPRLSRAQPALCHGRPVAEVRAAVRGQNTLARRAGMARAPLER